MSATFLRIFEFCVVKSGEPQLAVSIFGISVFHSVLQRPVAAQIPCASVLQGGCVQLKFRVLEDFEKPENLSPRPSPGSF